MTEKTEWEVVDADANQSQANQAPPRRTPDDIFKAVLGPWWRWKVGAVTVVAGIALLFFAALAGVIVLTVIAFAMLSLGIARLRRWLRSSSTRDLRR